MLILTFPVDPIGGKESGPWEPGFGLTLEGVCF